MKNSTARKLKQVPKGYLVMGIDPHKKRHAAVAMTQDFTTHSKFKFNNSKEGFEVALERIRAEMLTVEKRREYNHIQPRKYVVLSPTCSLSHITSYDDIAR